LQPASTLTRLHRPLMPARLLRRLSDTSSRCRPVSACVVVKCRTAHCAAGSAGVTPAQRYRCHR
jgi:hypothetical protein